MKKAMIYITILLLVTVITVSGTYAFFMATSSGTVSVGGHEIKVIYSGDTEISGEIALVHTKEEGFRRTVSIAEGAGSVDVKANLYIYLTNLDAGLSSKALIWELYELNGETETYKDSGTFYGYSSGEKIYMLKDLDINLETKEYAIYLWLNGDLAGNEVIDASLTGYIGAETNQITGITS